MTAWCRVVHPSEVSAGWEYVRLLSARREAKRAPPEVVSGDLWDWSDNRSSEGRMTAQELGARSYQELWSYS